MQRQALTPQKSFLPFFKCKSEHVTFSNSKFKYNSEKLIDNPNLQKKYGLNAYNHVKNNFTPDILIKKLEEFYTKL